MQKPHQRLLLLAGNFRPELTGIGKYNGEMIDWLAQNGYDCTVVTTFPFYPQWKKQEPYTKYSWYYHETIVDHQFKFPIQVYRCPHYIPKGHPTGFKRIISDFTFTLAAFFQTIKLLFAPKFDVIMVVAPPYHSALLALFYKLFKKTKIIYHVQDLQVDAAIQMGLIKFKPLERLLYASELFLLKQSQLVSTISDSMIKKIQAKGIQQVHLFSNWANAESIFPIQVTEFPLTEPSIPTDKKLIFYSGAIGEKQGIDIVLEIAALLKEKGNNDFVFLISSEGSYKAALKKKVEQQKLNNIYFSNLQSTPIFNLILNYAYMHLVLQKKDAEDLVLPSKLTNILAVGGVSIVTTQPNTSLYQLVYENKIGIVAAPGNAAEIVDTIVNISMSDYNKIKVNANNYANKYLNKSAILQQYFHQVYQA